MGTNYRTGSGSGRAVIWAVVQVGVSCKEIRFRTPSGAQRLIGGQGWVHKGNDKKGLWRAARNMMHTCLTHLWILS